MPFNEKLTPLVAGRTIDNVARSPGLLTLTFDDGSVMQIKTGGPAPAADALADHVLHTVHQAGTQMDLTFTDHTAARIRLAEATSSVLLRDHDGNFRYAD